MLTRLFGSLRSLFLGMQRGSSYRPIIPREEVSVPLASALTTYTVVDTNFLRDPELDRIIASCNDTFVLLDEILNEMMKTNPGVTVRRSANIIRRHPKRFAVAKSAPDLIKINPSYAKYEAMLDEHSQALIQFLSIVGRSFPSYNELVAVQAASALANRRISLLTSFRPGDWSGSFTKPDAEELRRGRLTMDVLQLLKSGACYVARNMLRDAKLDFCIVKPSDVTNSYAFRLPLSKMLYSFIWSVNGRPVKRESRRKNDLMDAEIACTGSLFHGILTRDRGCQTIDKLIRDASRRIGRNIDDELLPFRRRDSMGFTDKRGIKLGLSSDRVLDILAQPVERARPQNISISDQEPGQGD